MYNKGRNPRGNRPKPAYPPTAAGGGMYGNAIRNTPRKQGMHPALKAALIMIIPIILVQVLNAFVFNILSIYLYPIQLICYLVGGILAARFFADSLHFVRPRNLRDQPVKNGAIAGLTLGIVNLAFQILFMVVLNLVSFGLSIFGSVTYVICAPLDILLALLLGALGGKLFDNSWR
jgi:hypothetical protein